MANQFPIFVLGIFSCASVITTTFWNQWSVSGPTSSGVLGPIWAWRSLFGECMQYQGGQSQCQGQNSMFLMAGYKLALRGMLITAIILSTSASFCLLLGMECTSVLQERRNAKRSILIACGYAYLATAILTLASVVWYTFVVYDEFFQFENQDNYIQWELGACVYLGYISSLFSSLAGLACLCCPGQREEDDSSKTKSFYYKPRPFECATSRDDEQTRGLLDRYRYRHSKSTSSRSSSSRRSSSKHHSSKKSSSSKKSNLYSKCKGSGSKNSSSTHSASTLPKKCAISTSSDQSSSVDTYRYSAYV